MTTEIALVLFDLAVTAFLLWCLVNFIREGHRLRRAALPVMRVDTVPERMKAHFMSIAAYRERAMSAGEEPRDPAVA